MSLSAGTTLRQQRRSILIVRGEEELVSEQQMTAWQDAPFRPKETGTTTKGSVWRAVVDAAALHHTTPTRGRGRPVMAVGQGARARRSAHDAAEDPCPAKSY
jgi:hypothetical protein